MNYYYHGAGEAIIKPEITADAIKNAVEALPLTKHSEFEYEVDGHTLWITFMHDEYSEGEVKEWLNAIVPFISAGEIRFNSEDDTNWALLFDPQAHEWHEESGKIVYGKGKLVDISKLCVLSVYHSFNSECPVYLFSSEEEAVAELKKQVEEEIRIETEENGHILGEDIFLTKADDYSFAQIRNVINADGEEEFTEWNIGQLIDRTKGGC